jgi:hypothetical protein
MKHMTSTKNTRNCIYGAYDQYHNSICMLIHDQYQKIKNYMAYNLIAHLASREAEELSGEAGLAGNRVIGGMVGSKWRTTGTERQRRACVLAVGNSTGDGEGGHWRRGRALAAGASCNANLSRGQGEEKWNGVSLTSGLQTGRISLYQVASFP